MLGGGSGGVGGQIDVDSDALSLPKESRNASASDLALGSGMGGGLGCWGTSTEPKLVRLAIEALCLLLASASNEPNTSRADKTRNGTTRTRSRKCRDTLFRVVSSNRC